MTKPDYLFHWRNSRERYSLSFFLQNSHSQADEAFKILANAFDILSDAVSSEQSV